MGRRDNGNGDLHPSPGAAHETTSGIAMNFNRVLKGAIDQGLARLRE